MAKLTTNVSNSHLKNAVKALTAWTDRVESGEFELEPGTYHAFKGAREHISCEIAKQHRQRKRKINVNIVSDPERQNALRRQYER
tara:strand:- start:1061 stop:1315 length:255 start_codon:yes stop_codon:yes gene_type:complete